MPNYIPYLLLTLISLTLLVVMMVRERRMGIIVLFFLFSGMIYVAEYFVFIIGNSYEYFPEILHIRYYDNAMGAIVSNLLIVPALATLVALYKLRFGWIFFIATLFVGVELLFIQLHIFELHWWRTIYTWILFFCFFYWARYWLNQLKKGSGFIRNASLWIQSWSAVGTVMFLLSVFGVRYYYFGVYEDMHRDDLFVGSLVGVLKAGIFTVFISCCKQVKWRLLALPLVLAVDIPLYYIGLQWIQISYWLYTAIFLLLYSLLLWWNGYAYRFLWGMGREG